MAELKTKLTNKSVSAFIKEIESKEKQDDAKALLKIFKDITGFPPKLWGESIVGFGLYHYESTRSSQKGDWPLTGFSPRKQNLTIYIMPGFKEYGEMLKRLGKHKTSVSCLYIKKLSDIDTNVLSNLIKTSVKDMKRMYKVTR
ncbi:MAG: DUF1801 domain-containing protein [Candidatus Pacebacteria bacterium]|nr:DUF1801 domain-containing protein [Candidatus Paceibacterota bacterium]MBP9842381.1 DUF1801 domain-containing protein [Candidatus Paceibacterota bacterium]